MIQVFLLSLAAASATCADVILEDEFESLDSGWTVSEEGVDVSCVHGGVKGKCLRTKSSGKTAYCTRYLDPQRLRGERVRVRAMVKLEDVKQGDPIYCTAKLHIAVFAGGRVINHATRFIGTRDWHLEELRAEIPENAERIQLDLGIQQTSGTAYYDQLVVDDMVEPRYPLNLLAVANTTLSDGVADDGRGGWMDTGRVDLFALPRGDLTLAGLPVHIATFAEVPDGRECLVLSGAGKRWPRASQKSIKVGRPIRELAFLHAAAPATPAGQECLRYRITYADGTTEVASVIMGEQIGSFIAPGWTDQWRQAWQGSAGGKPVGIGCYRWRNPHPETPVESVTPEAVGETSTVGVVAVTAIR